MNKRLKRNKTTVYAIVILAASGLLLSSVLAYFGSGGIRPIPDNTGQNYASTIADLEYQISQYEASLEQSPDNFFLLSQLGNTYYQLGMVYSNMAREEKAKESFAKAVEPYGKALEINPEDTNVRVDRAVVAFWSDNYELAQAEFNTAIEKDPTHAKAHFNYGIFLYLGLNNPEGAIASWTNVIALNPADDPEIVSTARNWIAQVEEDMQRLLEGGQFLPGGTETNSQTEQPKAEQPEAEEKQN